VHAQRARALDSAFQLHPERFVRNPPKPAALPQAVWINPPAKDGPSAQ
jgi:putative transposase